MNKIPFIFLILGSAVCITISFVVFMEYDGFTKACKYTCSKVSSFKKGKNVGNYATVIACINFDNNFCSKNITVKTPNLEPWLKLTSEKELDIWYNSIKNSNFTCYYVDNLYGITNIEINFVLWINILLFGIFLLILCLYLYYTTKNNTYQRLPTYEESIA